MLVAPLIQLLLGLVWLGLAANYNQTIYWPVIGVVAGGLTNIFRVSYAACTQGCQHVPRFLSAFTAVMCLAVPLLLLAATRSKQFCRRLPGWQVPLSRWCG